MKQKISIVLNIILGLAFIFLLAQRLPLWINHSKMESQTAPVIKVVNLKQEPTELPLKDKKPSVLFFWATWCGPCHYEMEQLQKAIDENQIPSDRIFAINIGESLDLIEEYIKKNKFSFQFYIDSFNSSAQTYNIQVTPTVIHIDPDGRVLWMTGGINPLLVGRTKALFEMK